MVVKGMHAGGGGEKLSGCNVCEDRVLDGPGSEEQGSKGGPQMSGESASTVVSSQPFHARPFGGVIKVNFERLFRKRVRFSPNIDKNEEMAPRTRTGHPYEGPFAASQLATERDFFMDNLLVRIRLIIKIIQADRPRAKGVLNSNFHSASYLPS